MNIVEELAFFDSLKPRRADPSLIPENANKKSKLHQEYSLLIKTRNNLDLKSLKIPESVESFISSINQNKKENIEQNIKQYNEECIEKKKNNLLHDYIEMKSIEKFLMYKILSYIYDPKSCVELGFMKLKESQESQELLDPKGILGGEFYIINNEQYNKELSRNNTYALIKQIFPDTITFTICSYIYDDETSLCKNDEDFYKALNNPIRDRYINISIPEPGTTSGTINPFET
jgi:hypothetical protein